MILASEHFIFRRYVLDGYDLTVYDSSEPDTMHLGRLLIVNLVKLLPIGAAGIIAGCAGAGGAVIGMAGTSQQLSKIRYQLRLSVLRRGLVYRSGCCEVWGVWRRSRV